MYEGLYGHQQTYTQILDKVVQLREAAESLPQYEVQLEFGGWENAPRSR
jgi:hypothetical protein